MRGPAKIPTQRESLFTRSALLVVYYSIPAWLSFTSVSAIDPDIWWHIRTGQWIVQHHWLPYYDSFSTYGMGKPWAAYSWLFEILIYGLFSKFGLFGLLVYVYVLLLSISIALHSLVRKFQKRLAYSVALSALTIFALVHMRTPRPWLFTILFFVIELAILLSVRRSRKYRTLFFLVPLFTLWANLHIQFVYGLFVLGLAALESPINRLLHRQDPNSSEDRALPVAITVILIAGCMAATLINPYHVRIYAVVLDTARQGGLYQLISELSALDFRSLPDWLVLGLTVAAVFVLGRRRGIASFWFLLLGAAIFLSFRSKRDVWFVTITAAIIICLGRGGISAARDQISKGQTVLVGLICIVVLGVTPFILNASNSQLEKEVAKRFPAAAASFVEQERYQGPLYNHFDWGGYLIWRLPTLPVSIDGRSNVHDAERIKHSAEVWSGYPPWSSDSELAIAHLIVAEKQFPLTQLLRLDSRFTIVYEDDVSVVFVRSGLEKQ